MNGAYNLPMDDQAEALAIQRRMRLADILRQQSLEAPKATMVGKQLVAPNPLQRIAQVMGGVMANRKERGAMDEANRYAQDKRQRIAQALAGIRGLDNPQAMTEAGVSLASTGIPELTGMGSQLLTGGVNAGVMDRRMAQQEQIRAGEREADRVARESAAAAEREWRAEQARIAAQERADLQRELKGMGGQANPYYTPIYTPQGVFGFDARSGNAAPVVGPDGKPLVRATDDPGLTREISGAKAGGKVEEETRTQARLALPGLESKTRQMISHIDALKNHEGMSDVVGAPNVLTLGGLVPGTKGADFRALLDQVKGGTFLQAFETLKGGGQITEVEGRKATDAIARMQTAQSEDAFRAAADEFQQVLAGALERSRQMAGAVPGGINPGAQAGPKPGTVEDGHRFKGGDPADPNNWERVQ